VHLPALEVQIFPVMPQTQGQRKYSETSVDKKLLNHPGELVGMYKQDYDYIAGFVEKCRTVDHKRSEQHLVWATTRNSLREQCFPAQGTLLHFRAALIQNTLAYP
jgi:hypothetical protein